MAFDKVNYVDNTTVIHAENLNNIQEKIEPTYRHCITLTDPNTSNEYYFEIHNSISTAYTFPDDATACMLYVIKLLLFNDPTVTITDENTNYYYKQFLVLSRQDNNNLITACLAYIGEEAPALLLEVLSFDWSEPTSTAREWFCLSYINSSYVEDEVLSIYNRD